MCQRDPTGNGEFVRNKMNLLKRLPPFDSRSGTLNIVIDTPKECRSKFAYDISSTVAMEVLRDPRDRYYSAAV